MAEFCKIKSDGSTMSAPNPLRIVVSNPSDERYRYEGWLEKRYAEPPEYDPETQYLTEHWEQDGQYAVQKWTVHDIQELPDGEEAKQSIREQYPDKEGDE